MSRKASLNQFIRTSGVFFVGTVLSRAISILMLPLYTSRIPTEDMGYYDLSLTYVVIATSVLFIDIWVAILRFMYDEDSKEHKSSCMRSGMVIFSISSLIYLLIGSALAIFTNIESIIWIIIYGLFHNITNIFTFSARGYGKNVEFALSGIINTIVNVMSNVICIIGFSMGYQSLYLSSILGCFCQMVFLFWRTNLFSSWSRGIYCGDITRRMLKYSLPLCVNSISYWVLTSFNRVIINLLYGNSANGIYAVGHKFAVVINMATTCFTYAWQDLAFSSANKLDNPGKFYSDACNLYSKVLAMSMAIMLPCIKLVFPLLVNNAYSAAASTIPLFLISAILAAISTFIGNIFYATKDTKMIFISMLFSALFNLIIGYPLIKSLGLNGANIAVILSFSLNILIRNKILNKKIGFYLDKQLLLLGGLILLSYFVYSCCSIWINIIMLLASLVLLVLLFRQYLHMIPIFSGKKEGKTYD